MQPDLRQKLRLYHDLLLKWQKSVNLIAPSTVPDAWERHFEDSLQLVSLIPKEARVLADLGSGAGFPGLVIAMARPDLMVHLIESDSKKAAFLNAVSRETGITNIRVHSERAESVLPSLVADVVTARALAGLTDLLVMSESQWARSAPALLIFPKGAEWRKEVDLARADHVFQVLDIPSKTDRRAAILCITGVGPRGHA